MQTASEHDHLLKASHALCLAGIGKILGFSNFEEYMLGSDQLALAPIPPPSRSLIEECARRNKELPQEPSCSRMRIVLVDYRPSIAQLCEVLNVNFDTEATHRYVLRTESKRTGVSWEICQDGSLYHLLSPRFARERFANKGYKGLDLHEGLCLLLQCPEDRQPFRNRRTDMIETRLTHHRDRVPALTLRGKEIWIQARFETIDLPSTHQAFRLNRSP